MRLPLGRRALIRRTLIATSAAALILPVIAGGAFADPSNSRSTIAGSKPAWATSSLVAGTPSAATKITFNVVLPLRDAAGAAKLAANVSDPASPDYGHYVTAAQFNAKYAPTGSQVAKLKSYLGSAGLHVTSVAAGNRWVSASGTVRQIEHAFSTTLRNYRYKGRTVREPSSSLSVPRSVAGLISGIVGVGTEGTLRRPAVAPTPAATPPTQVACATYWNQTHQVGPAAYGLTSFPTSNCGYSPAQLRSAYGVQPSVTSGDTGHGVTVAIIDAYASPTMLSDANAYSTFQNEPTFAAGQYTETQFTPFDLQTECGGEPGWNEEESLDVEAIHGMAPGANVHYFGAQDCDTGIDDATNNIIQNHLADIVSNSYGSVGEDGLGSEETTEHAMYVQAAAEGIGFYFSTGDDGDNVALDNLSHPEPDYPASDPMVTAVGGTSLAITSAKGYQFETSWGDDVDPVSFASTPSKYSLVLPGSFTFGGGGGGVSALFAQPSYQAAKVPASLAKLNGSQPKRVSPDIAAVADPFTGYLIEYAGVREVIGGTSLACPVIAGIQALASQRRSVAIGFANPLLYTLGAGAFHDVKAPATPVGLMTQSGFDLITFGKDSSLTSTAGYDDTTGLGTPFGLAFLNGEVRPRSAVLPPNYH